MGILTFQDEQFYMDGQPFRILSGALHYFRVVPQYWEDRLKKLKACGFNTVETYTCWNLHERKEGQFDFSGGLDLERFITLAESLGLYVIVRPGPYICAEWDLGGLPSWLLTYDNMGLRCNDDQYLAKVRPYYEQLFQRIRPHLATHGGGIIMVQVENEYGSYGDDKDYLRKVEAIYRECGIDCLLFTADGTDQWMLNGGTLPHLLSVANFGSHPTDNFRRLRQFKQHEPLMCGEFWSGWFDHWYDGHHTRTAQEVAQQTDELLGCGASINFYMFHGGTNFAFTNGANHYGVYEPTITSYDYCAPLSEAGDMTPTYYAVQEVLARYGGQSHPELAVANLPKAAYGALTLTEKAPLLDNLRNLGEPIYRAYPPTMEQVGQDFGYIVYATTLKGPFEPQDLILTQVHDRAIVYLNGKRVGLRERSRVCDEIKIGLAKGETARLEILVENMGRVNYGPKLFDKKGIVGGIRLGQQFHFGWEVTCLPMEDLSGLAWQPETDPGSEGAVFLRGTLKLDQPPCDTFVRLDGFTKGIVLVNGFNLGRYFNPAGPQKTLYLPAPLLHCGDNEIVVFESDGYEKPVITFHDTPDLG